MDSLNNLAFTLGGWANALPAAWRKRVYKTVKVLASLATLALLVLPALPGLGISVPDPDHETVILTALLAFLGHLADRNTDVPDQVDVTAAPEAEEQRALNDSAA
jgi:hypothetical protein